MTRFVRWSGLAALCILVGLTALSVLYAQTGGRQGETRPDFSTDEQTRIDADGYATDWGEAHWLIWGRIGLRRAIC